VKRNAIAGRSFPSWKAFEAHLEACAREVADVRVHGTTGEAPIERFRRAEATALKSIAGRTGWVRIYHGSQEVAVHATCAGCRQRAIDPAHFQGVAGFRARCVRPGALAVSSASMPAGLLRSLNEYEALLGGGF
jgi:hypothetical protein